MTTLDYQEGRILRSAIIEDQLIASEVPAEIAEVLKDPSYVPSVIPAERCQSVLLLDDGVRVKFASGMEKILSYPDFVKALGSAIEGEQTATGTPFNLPPNVFFFAHSASELMLNMYYPSTKNMLKFNPDGRTKTFEIIMPNLIISHILKAGSSKGQWKVSTTKYFCTDLPISKLPKTFINRVSPNERIFLLPMSNTYGEGNMCYGGNAMPINMVDNNLRELNWYYEYLWQSAFNTDLGIRALSSGGNNVAGWYDLLKQHASKNEPFPYNKLSGYTPL